jgi:hypothetical protein
MRDQAIELWLVLLMVTFSAPPWAFPQRESH